MRGIDGPADRTGPRANTAFDLGGSRICAPAEGEAEPAMNDGELRVRYRLRESPIRLDEPVGRSAGNGARRLIILAFGLVGIAIGFALIEGEGTEPLMIGLLAVLAVAGVAGLLALALGVIRLGAAPAAPAPDITRAHLDSLPEGVMIVDASGRLVYANRAYAALTGSPEKGDVRPVERLFSGDAKAGEAIYRIAQAAREGRAAEEEVRLSRALSAGGPPGARWYRISARPIAAGGGAGGVAWTIADVTGERARQESVFQDLQYAIDYLDHAPVGFFSAEPDGRIAYINATLAEWLGIDIAHFEAGSLTLWDIVRGENLALLTGGPGRGRDRTETIDLDLVKRNGQSLPVRLLHRVSFAPDGAPGSTRTVVLNRSPGEEGSEALRAAEVRFTRFFNNTPIAIAAVDRAGGIGRTNAAFLKLFKGALGNDEAGRKLVDLVAPGDREAVATALESAVKRSASIPPIDVAIAGDGERSARIYINAVEDGADGKDAVIVNAIDITEQRALERQFAQSQKMETVGKLAGGIAHDFNNVLTAIIGFCDLLLANHRPSDPSFQDIMNIKQNANRAAGLVRQLLAFSRRQTLRPQVLQLGDLISDLSVLLTRLLGENVRLEVSHGPDLWPIKADLNQFEQVIVNLAVNARDAMPGGGTMTIRTRNLPAPEVAGFPYRPLPAADYVLLEIEDTGSGIPPEVQGRIFEPFFSTKEVGKGTGLGLSTVYGIVKQTEAFIYFDSTVGKGTVFRIFIPRYIPTADEKADTAAEPETRIADLTGSAAILLVEDEEAVRSFAARALASRGYRVYEASSGIEALEVMKEAGGQIDLVVSDVVMPELDGPSLLRELRRTRPDLKIIFISGYAEEAFRKNLPQGETFQFLPKPFSLKQLAVAVKETLGR
jgi:two-component system cell cycle sensor histidine kinase/response regulator CckA